MKKLFTAIRHSDIEEVKRILDKKPEEVNCVAGPTPKKDHGQSPLQVALKNGQIEIADYLIDHGADINYCEAEDEDNGLRMPVIFDAITAIIDSLCYKKFDISDKALIILKKLINNGANVNSFTSNGLGTFNWAVLKAGNIILYPNLYMESQVEVRNKLARILDLLIENGVDIIAWADRGYYAKPSASPTSRVMLLNPVNMQSGLNLEKMEPMRDFMQEYFRSKDIILINDAQSIKYKDFEKIQ